MEGKLDSSELAANPKPLTPDPQKKGLEAENGSSYMEDSDEFTDWTEEDEEDEENSNQMKNNQNMEDDFLDFQISGKRYCGDGEEQPPAASDKTVDDDEDKKNPAYVPRKGSFFEHDLRKVEDEDGGEKKDKTKDEKNISFVKLKEPPKPFQKDKEKWQHDRFDEKSQRPKSVHELVTVYGFNIRKQEKCYGSLVRPIFKNRYRGPIYSERISSRRRNLLFNKKSAFRTFIVVKNNEEMEEDEEEDEEEEVSKIEKIKSSKNQDKISFQENIEKTVKFQPKPSILKTSKVSEESKTSASKDSKSIPLATTENKNEETKTTKSISFVDSPQLFNQTKSFEKTNHQKLNNQITKKSDSSTLKNLTNNQNINQNNNSNDRLADSSQTTINNLNNYNFPGFTGELFIGRPIYSIKGNFKKKKATVGSGRIAPVVGGKSSNKLGIGSGGIIDSENETYVENHNHLPSNNLIYTNSNYKKYSETYQRSPQTFGSNKVVIEVKGSFEEEFEERSVLASPSSEEKYFPPNPMFRKNFFEYNYNNSCYKNNFNNYYMNRHPKFKKMQNWWGRGDGKCMGQDVRLIVMCSGESQETSSRKSPERKPQVKNEETKEKTGRVKRENMKQSSLIPDILPPVTCSVITRSHKSIVVYSVAEEKESNQIEKNEKKEEQAKNKNNKEKKVIPPELPKTGGLELIVKNSSALDNNLKRYSQQRPDNIVKTKLSTFPRLPITPKNRMFHSTSFSNSPVLVPSSFILPPGPFLSNSKQTTSHINDKNNPPFLSHQLIALPVRVTPVPFLLTHQSHLHQHQQHSQLPNKPPFSQSFSSTSNNLFLQNPFNDSFNNFKNNKNNQIKLSLSSSKTPNHPIPNSSGVSKPSFLPLHSKASHLFPNPSHISKTTILATTTITTPTSLALTSKLSPHAAAFTSNKFSATSTKPSITSTQSSLSSACSKNSSSNFTSGSPLQSSQTKPKSAKSSNKLLGNTIYELTPVSKYWYRPNKSCPIEVRGGTVFFSPEIQPSTKRAFSAGKKTKTTISTGIILEKTIRPKKVLPIVDPKTLKEMEEARRGDGCEADENKIKDQNLLEEKVENLKITQNEIFHSDKKTEESKKQENKN